MQIPHHIAGFFVALAFVVAHGSGHKHEHQHKGHHHHHHKGHHHHHHGKHNTTAAKVAEHAASKTNAVAAQKTVTTKVNTNDNLVANLKFLESKMAKKIKAQELAAEKGHIMVMGPLPADFSERFAQAVAYATGADAKKVVVTATSPAQGEAGIFAVDFKADPKIVKAVVSQAADSDSKLAQGNLHSFLVKPDAADEESGRQSSLPEATPVEEKGLDIDTAMPYGELEPFGREDTAQELTEDSISESNQMVDQLERAEVAEEKRAVFRALTRLRGAAITSFDGVARSQTGNIDEYNKIHQWRKTHPLHHLADEESDVSKWAFPDNADF